MSTSQHECDEQKLNGTGCTSTEEIRTPAIPFVHIWPPLQVKNQVKVPPPAHRLVTLDLEITDVLRAPFGVFSATIACGPLGSVTAIVPLDSLSHAAYLHLVTATGPQMRTGS